MASTEQIRLDIKELIKEADLTTLTAKKVRQQLEEKYDCSLSQRKKEIDELLMKILEQQNNSDSESEQSCDELETSNNCQAAAAAPAGSHSPEPSPHSEAADLSDSDIDLENGDLQPQPRRKKLKKTNKVSEDEKLAMQLQDEDGYCTRSTRSGGKKRPTPKKTKKKKVEGDKSEKKRSGLYGRPCLLSGPLSAFLGTDRMARSRIVQRMWEIIKERDLLDPKNKSFMRCDGEMQKLFGRKRVRTFGMMKCLQNHIYTVDEEKYILEQQTV